MQKHFFLLALLGLSLLSCNQNEPKAMQQVTFTVEGLAATTEPMQLPQKQYASSLLDDDGKSMTDLYLFDGTTQLAHQVSTDSDFGTITVMLSAGSHDLHFVATRATELNYNAGTLSMGSVRPTFGKHLTLNVTGSSVQNIDLERVTGQVVLTIEDEIPSDAKTLVIAIGDYCKGLQVETFNGANQAPFEVSVDISSKVGTTGYSATLNHIVPIFGTEHETSYTVTVKSDSETVIAQASGTMPINSNTKTLLHGALFKGTSTLFSLTTAWNADIEVNM